MKVYDPDLIEKRARLLQKQRNDKIKSEFGLPFYQPHEKQNTFHRAADFKGRYLRTGNRFGKSDCGAAEDCAFLLGERPWLPKSDPGRYLGIPKTPTKGLLITQDWAKAEEIFTSELDGDRRGKLLRFLPRKYVTLKRNGKYINELRVQRLDGNGESVLHIDTVAAYKQNKLGAESSDWDFIHVDEPIPEGFWTAISRGLMDRDGKYWFTCTPLSQPWINNHFIPMAQIRSDFDKPLENGRRWVITGSIWDNPHIPKAAALEYLNDLSDAERACRESGIPTALSGIIYKQFDPDRHIINPDTLAPPHGWEDWLSPPLSNTIRVWIDLHPKEPQAVHFWATNELGQAICYHEIFFPYLIPDLIENMQSVLNGRIPFVIQVDPIAWIKNPVNNRSMADEFYERSIPIVAASKQLDYGVLKAQTALSKPDFLYFSPMLTETIYEFHNYSWQENKEKPEDVRDHMMENFYRATLEGLSYVPPNGDTPRIPPTNLSSSKKAIKLRTLREARAFSSPSKRNTTSRRYPA